MSKIKNSAIAPLIAQLIRNDADAISDGIKCFPLNRLEEMADEWIESLRADALTEKIFRNTAPTMPGDNQPGSKTYPDREELKPTPVSVPDPAKTETATPTKISIPAEPELQRFTAAMGEAAKAAGELWKIPSDENWQKNSKRSDAFDWLDEAKSALYDV